MSEAEFNDRLGREFQRRRRKLDAYEDFIKGLLQEAQFLSSAQVPDANLLPLAELMILRNHYVVQTGIFTEPIKADAFIKKKCLLPNGNRHKYNNSFLFLVLL